MTSLTPAGFPVSLICMRRRAVDSSGASLRYPPTGLSRGVVHLMRAIAAGASDVGLQREHNEDSYVVLKEYDLFVVADGMGGHRAGDVASKLATETISEFFKSTANAT